MREIRTSGLMSGDGKRDGAVWPHPRPPSTLPATHPGINSTIKKVPRA